MKFRPKMLLAALALAGVAGAAQADVLKVDVNNGYTTLAQAPGYQGEVAQWSVTNTTVPAVGAPYDSFVAYCLQMMESVEQVGEQNYSRVSFAANADVQELYDRFYSSSLTSAVNAVGFQLALWDLLGQADATSFVTGLSGAGAAALMMLDEVHNGTDPYQQDQYELISWISPDNQDLLQAVSTGSGEVPEPNALVLGGVGLLALGWASRRRKTANRI
ncbi:PEP-CTERM sorting domain-containing protein [Pseudorhodoferax sp. Leaf265]|uniref:PEP-CTERM sorting domain-containing protein n=1 Tax=Pseudorhodoferax sp. Leaf265 TaxID=1736315 RepID=UPI00138F2ADB|nr:PEP-CTERM sorting domain-containing protein [Pseudorhodoferax sp. Leaf265]